MVFDPKKASKILKDIVATNGNWYQKGEVVVPGAIPNEYWNERYLINVEDVIKDPLVPEPPIELELATHKLTKPVDYDKISLDTATVAEILTVEGIGNQNANRIIKDRDEKGKFGSIDNLVERLPGLTKFKAALEERFTFE
jgi:Helix-hairpin-helix motif